MFLDIFKKIKKQEDKDNCPTNVLLYLSTARMCPYEVTPWYDKIKEYSGGANLHYPEFHRATILGMFPEFEKATEYFNGILHNGGKLTQERLARAEQETMRAFHMPKTYFIGELTEEQKQRVQARQRPLIKKFIDKEIAFLPPAVQVLACALRKALPEDEAGFAFSEFFTWVKACLDNEGNFNRGKSNVPKDVCQVVEGVFELKKQGVLGDQLEIKNYDDFKESSVVKGFNYKGKKYDVRQHLMSQSQAGRIKQAEFSF